MLHGRLGEAINFKPTGLYFYGVLCICGLWLTRQIIYSGSKTLCSRLLLSEYSYFMITQSGVEMTTQFYH